MPNEKVMVQVYENGDTEYLTPLPELEVNAYKSDIELGSNATYSQYADWFLKNLGIEAADKAQYATRHYYSRKILTAATPSCQVWLLFSLSLLPLALSVSSQVHKIYLIYFSYNKNFVTL